MSIINKIMRNLAYLFLMLLMTACVNNEYKEVNKRLNQDIHQTLKDATDDQRKCFNECLGSFKGDMYSAKAVCVNKLKKQILHNENPYESPETLKCSGGHGGANLLNNYK